MMMPVRRRMRSRWRAAGWRWRPPFRPTASGWPTRPNGTRSPAATSNSRAARADGTDRHQVTGAVGYYGWDPTEDLLAISTAYTVLLRGNLSRFSAETRLELVGPTGRRRDLVNLALPTKAVLQPLQVWDASWSPSGQAIAVAIDSFVSGSTIRSHSLDGGNRRRGS